ncbi:metallophosphoesterase family protein [Saccharopolyspora erythraea]|uniref:SimX4 homolog n=3 Tax=Saccharopolyspora erythraea TaxID=1836 RepID=A4FGY8_SACEN|nr:metallophosphoesterase [Saccharopolyspora erythraea]QRK87227.1 metallophosphoesterase [Saccharopolyspora erythraea]CAM03313.1 SimX4 homolog [Saccharopolyspora erythraea NRRL 2338]
MSGTAEGKLFATSDLHVGYSQNREIVERLVPESDDDWLIVAGDVGELAEQIEWALSLLSKRFSRVLWVPGNHELWTPSQDSVQLRGDARYRHLVELCRGLGVVTPEDPYPVWEGAGGPARVAPLFLLYDYSFLPPGTSNSTEALKKAYDTGVVCSDEFLLHPDPYPSRQDWCEARVTETEKRLEVLDDDIPLVLVNHYPLVRQPTDVLYYPVFAQWCGTERTADWHRRFRVSAVVYGHLHIPRRTRYDGVPFEEVSIGYPREWGKRGHPHGLMRQILPPLDPADRS